MPEWMSKLERAKALLDSGVLTPEEYDAEKARLLPTVSAPGDGNGSPIDATSGDGEARTSVRASSGIFIMLTIVAFAVTYFLLRDRPSPVTPGNDQQVIAPPLTRTQKEDNKTGADLEESVAVRDETEPAKFEKRLSPKYLNGSWGYHSSCATELAAEFKSGGRFRDGSRKGRYSIVNGKIKLDNLQRLYGDDPEEYINYPDESELRDSLLEVSVISENEMILWGIPIFRC